MRRFRNVRPAYAGFGTSGVWNRTTGEMIGTIPLAPTPVASTMSADWVKQVLAANQPAPTLTMATGGLSVPGAPVNQNSATPGYMYVCPNGSQVADPSQCGGGTGAAGGMQQFQCPNGKLVMATSMEEAALKCSTGSAAMSDTTKYLLIGAAALVALLLLRGGSTAPQGGQS